MNGVMDFDTFMSKYAFSEPYIVEQRESGMNNITRIITSGDKRFVLRIYNNHKNAQIVKLEHEVLEALSRQQLTFDVPVPVRNKAGDTVAIASDGTISSLFHYIEGDRPEPSLLMYVKALGQTAGQLTLALSKIKLHSQPIYTPYYLLESTYSSMDASAFIALTERSEKLKSRLESVFELLKEREKVAAACDSISLLPKQWIHGDLVFNNTVAQGATINGVLDFEFTTIDARAMELAVIIVDLIKPDLTDCKAKVQTLIEGYSETITLTDSEREKLPILMKLRLLDVVLHFAIRLRDGLDNEDVLCKIIDESLYGCHWINKQWEDVKYEFS